MESKTSKLKLPKQASDTSTVNPALVALFNAPPPAPAKKKSPPPPPPSPRVRPAAADNKRKQPAKSTTEGSKKADGKKVEEGTTKAAEASSKKQRKAKKQKKEEAGAKNEDEEEQEDKMNEEDKPTEQNDEDDEDETKEESEEGDAEENDSEMDEETKKACTVFVGNVPVSMTKNELARLFKPHGKIRSIRFRSVAFAHPKRRNKDKKAAFLGKHFHPDRDTCNAYVVFTEKDSALKALAVNNTKIKIGEDEVAHLSVDLAYAPTWNMARAVFVGNLPFSIKDEELRKHFESAGSVKRIRIVRDSATSIGKGFGFVEFVNKDDMLGALALHESELQNRQIRVFKASNHEQAFTGNGKQAKKTERKAYQGMESLKGAALRVERKRKRTEGGGKGPKRGGKPKAKPAGRSKKARTA